MTEVERQLVELRARVARAAQACDERVARRRSEAPVLELAGNEVETALGRHFETQKLYAACRRHGSADIGALSDLPHDLLDKLSDGVIPRAAPEEWAFVDTETTGLAGGAGTCAFLIGVGNIERCGFRVRQLDALEQHLQRFRVMITYNGKAFDQPLLETRYRMQRRRPPFARMEHLDLLHGARRLWKLRFESCRLVDLENQVLGVERDGDIPGALIPYAYFEYLRSRQMARLAAVFEHNAMDILTLACLTGIVPHAFKDPGNTPLRHASEMAGLARWLRAVGDLEGARALLRRAIDSGPLRDELLFRAMWDLAQLERKLESDASAVAIWEDLAGARNPFRVQAMEELAKYHEHRAKDSAAALKWTRAARAIEDSPALEKRELRLLRKGGTALSRAIL